MAASNLRLSCHAARTVHLLRVMDLLEDLHRRVMPADGAMGTELFAAGVARGRCLEELCVSEPGLIRRVHARYLAAGARAAGTKMFWAEVGGVAPPPGGGFA